MLEAHHRRIVSRNSQQLSVVIAAVNLVVLVFACLESSTRAIHGGHGTGCCLLMALHGVSVAEAWVTDHLARRRSNTIVIDMGKGFNRARNKQAELAKKMAAAKSQNKAASSSDTTQGIPAKKKKKGNCISTNAGESRNDDAVQERRDDFEILLRTTKGAIPSGDDTESAYIAPIQAGSKSKPKQTISPANHSKRPRKRKTIENKEEEEQHQRVVEARRSDFESLIDVGTSAPLGPIGAAKLVPWVPPFLKKGLIVLVDPRSNSKDLRRAMEYHASSSRPPSKDAVDTAFVTADSVGETKAWLKRNEIDPTKLRILSDPRWSFMTKYEVVGDTIDHRWSMAMLTFDSRGDLVRIQRDVKPSDCGRLLSETTKRLQTKAGN